MKLYHGTRAPVGRRALTEGLKPRRETKRSNWAHTSPSHPDGVYLTDAYPLYFGISSLDRAAAAAFDHDRMIAAVVEIETDRLNPFALAPDEDVLEQVGRRVGDDLPARWTMRQRTIHYRNRLQNYTADGQWEQSLKNMGTCCHLGVIPAAAVTRVAFIDVGVAGELAWRFLQPMISLANYRFCGADYRKLTATIWDGGDGIIIEEGTKP